MGLSGFEGYCRMEDVDARIAQLFEIGRREGRRIRVPSLKLYPVERHQAEHVDHVRLGDESPRSRRLGSVRLRGRKLRLGQSGHRYGGKAAGKEFPAAQNLFFELNMDIVLQKSQWK